MSFHEAMNRFGVDKPDMRFGLELVDLSKTFADSSFKVFSGTVKNGGAVKAINAKGLADITQGELKGLEDAAKSLGAGLAFIKIEGGEWKSPIVKFFSEEEKRLWSRNSESRKGTSSSSLRLSGNGRAPSWGGSGWMRQACCRSAVRLSCDPMTGSSCG